MEKHYRFAGVELAVDIPEEWMYADDRRLAPFRVCSVKDSHRFSFRVTDALEPPTGACIATQPGYRVYGCGEGTVRYIGAVEQGWEPAYIRAAHHGKNHEVTVRRSELPGTIGVHTVLNALGAETLIAEAGGFVFHCSYIDRGGKAVLFTAPSETGKSTQAELWRRLRGAEIINGDRAAVRIVDGHIMAEGIPFSGSSDYCENRSLPIEAIVYLGQAKQTTIRKVRGYEAFAKIWEGVSVNTWNRRDVERVSAAVQQVAERIPVYHLPCTPDESAVIALERALEGRRES